MTARAISAPTATKVAAPAWQVWTALWIVYIVWGSTYLAIAIIVDSLPPMLMGGIRFTIAGLLIIGYVLIRNGLEPLRSINGESDAGYVNAVLARLQEIATVRQVAALKGRLQRMNPIEEADAYNKAFMQLLALEQQARSLRERAMGGLTP